jgi:DNA-binding NtrC family response regulator
VRNCAEARTALRGRAAPVLVFTDTLLADGTWADVLKVACAAPITTPVIVVSRFVDIRLYFDVLENSAHDFAVPPFAPADLTYIVRGTVLKVRSATSARPATAPARVINDKKH